MAFVSVFIQLIVLVHGLYDTKSYADFENQPFVTYVADILSMVLIRIVAIVAVIESWLKRSQHIAFLVKIEHIDTIVRTKLSIDLRYDIQREEFVRNCFMWIGAQVCLELMFLIMTCMVGLPFLQVFWALYTIPLFICLMRYQQFISYVDLLHDRYKVLNQYIESLYLKNKSTETDIEDSTTLIKHKYFNYSQSQRLNFSRKRDVEAFIIHKKLLHFQCIHRLLIEANKMVCRLFNWSMLLNMGNDFFNVLINLYWVIINFVRGDSKLELIGIVAWSLFNISMLISVTKACYCASYEVIK